MNEGNRMQQPSNSRFAKSRILQDAQGRRYVGDRMPYRYHPHPDNHQHAVKQNDTLASLAAHYYAPLSRACGFWWAIADFQPQPLVDPLRPLHKLHPVVVIPSLRVLTDIILPGSGQRTGAAW